MSRDWQQVLARRMESLYVSPFDDLSYLWGIEDIIMFSGGTPPVERVPAERFQMAMAQAWEEVDRAYLYGEGAGYPGLRELIAHRMAQRDVECRPDQLLVTNGSQQGIEIICRLMLDPGDQVIVEAPTYFGALQVFTPYHTQIAGAPTDEHGLIPAELERVLEGAPRAKILYTIPTFQNPTGATLAQERRQAILDLARKHDLVIVEDDPYGELAFDDKPRRPLRADDPDVVHLGTFSKTLLPALRIGWMVLPDAIHNQALYVKEASDIQSDRFVQRAIVIAARDGWLERHVSESRSLYAERCRLMLDALERNMPDGVTWNEPDGGFFVWLTLPDQLTADALLPIAADQAVGYLPGSAFYPDRRPSPALRLGFTTLPEQRIVNGIERLGRAVELALEREPAAR